MLRLPLTWGGGIEAVNDEAHLGINAEVEAPPPPPPPVLDAVQDEQIKVCRDMKALALSREHLLTYKPAN
eukprot:107281-Heterocapsa_arctica.AAC.1